MKINIFKIPIINIEHLKEKLESLGMIEKYKKEDDGWTCIFYLSTRPEIDDIPWVKDYITTIPELSKVKNVIYYAVYLCIKEECCFALTYGKSHFYVRSYCDNDFGLEMAKRIADENDVKQKASKRFSGRKKKEIKSFVKNTKLNNESGESIDYISASIVLDKQQYFGEKSKFGASIVISRGDLLVDKIINILNVIIDTMGEETKFDLPKTYEIKNVDLINEYNIKLLETIKNDISIIETEDSSYDLIGTDFVFYTNEKYAFYIGHEKSEEFSEFSHVELKKFIDENSIQDKEILNIKVEIKNENSKTYHKPLYEMIEFMVPNENVVLEQGKWKKFNEEYINQINASVDSITIDPVELSFQEISITEPEFNDSQEVLNAGYKKADTDFSIINIGTGYTVEAWDLQKDDTVYAVKFGPSQKLVYVCNQAIATLDIIRNNANRKKLDNPPKRYCLWLGFAMSNVPRNLSEIKSIILKQSVDTFARKCWDIGIEPVLKFSRKTNR